MREPDRSLKGQRESSHYLIGALAMVGALGPLWVAVQPALGIDWPGGIPYQWSVYRLLLMATMPGVTALIAVLLFWRIRGEEYRQRDLLHLAHTRQLQDAYASTLHALTAALDLRDSETWGHSRRVLSFSLAIGRRMGLTEAELNSLSWGALLHDVGKIGISDSILLKPGKLTAAERAAMNDHVEVGYRLVAAIPLLRPALDVIRYHHERYDGTGYPAGLAGTGIPLTARVFAVADAFDAMTSARPYRSSPMSFAEARTEIVRLSGAQFCPEAVAAFLALQDEELRQIQVDSFAPLTDFRQFLIDSPVDTESMHDHLTETYNRNSWEQVRLQLARWRGAHLGTVIFADIDGQKAVNDRVGQQAGDELLVAAAQCLTEAVHPSGTVYRYGGDEFLIWFPVGVDVQKIARQVEMAAEQFSGGLHGEGASPSLSWGMATATEETNSVDELVHLADKSMYQHKLARRLAAAAR